MTVGEKSNQNYDPHWFFTDEFRNCTPKIANCWEAMRLSFSTIQSSNFQFSSIQLLSHVRLFVTPWTAARQASLSFTNSQSLLKLSSIESVTPSNHLILCGSLLLPLQSFPPSGSFPMSQLCTSGGQSIGVSASASVLPINIKDWFL